MTRFSQAVCESVTLGALALGGQMALDFTQHESVYAAATDETTYIVSAGFMALYVAARCAAPAITGMVDRFYRSTGL